MTPEPGPPGAGGSGPLDAAERLVRACRGLARSLEGEIDEETIHQVAGRLVSVADVLGTILRSTAGRAPGELVLDGDPAFHWRAADKGAMDMFSHLYRAIPVSHPARQWFTDHERDGARSPHATDH